MSADWPMVPLGELTINLDARRIPVKESDRKTGPYPYYGASGIVDFVEGYLFDGDHLLIAEDGENLRTRQLPIAFMATGRFWVNNHAHIVIGNEKADTHFLMYALQNTDVSGYLTGAVMPKLTQANLNRIPLPCPSMGVQQAIVKNLRTLDDKIQLNRQINQTLEEMAQAIFKSWFVDFEPVKAKIEAKANGQDPERAAMCAISGAVQGCTNVAGARTAGATKTEEEPDQLEAQGRANAASDRISMPEWVRAGAAPPDQLAQLRATAALFPDELTDSELGPIPKGWEWSTIGKEVDVVGGGTPSTNNPDYWERGNFHWTTPKDLSGNQDKILLTTERKITKAGLGKISSGLLPVDTVLLSSRAPVGYLALAKVPVAINQGYIAMKCTKKLPPVYVLQWANSVMDDIKQRASGTTFAEISKKNFRIIPVLLPTEEVLSIYSQKANCLYDKITEAITEIGTLTQLRDTLLPKLLSGEISVGSAQATIQEAV